MLCLSGSGGIDVAGLPLDHTLSELHALFDSLRHAIDMAHSLAQRRWQRCLALAHPR
jgi:hypothetical protein